MSREVDERIVEMQFDNKQFETGVAQTIKSLDALNNSLKFDDLKNSLSSIQNGINRITLEPLQNAVMGIENSLTTFTGILKLKIFDRIADMAVNTGEKVFQALTFGSAKAGMAEYETQQGAVQTILANTQHLGTTVKDVVGALDELNEYADLTIYNFTEMTRNIGTFTAAGLDLETSTSAIKGIANLAAISGSTSAQASNAMYQLSQALSAGRVSLQDWNSVVNAGMGGKVFQDALKKTAKHMGIVVDESKSFRESIGGGDSWLSAEVLSETLKQLSGDMTDAELAAQGWSQTEIEEIQKMSKMGLEAATVVKTFSQLMDTLTEQIGSGWTKTWQLIFGDFEESKALWTGIYKAISPYIDAFSDLRNGYIEFWRENEGREKLIEAFSNIWSGATNVITKFTTAFKSAFPIVDTFGENLVDLTNRFLAFSERFKVVKDRAEQVTEAFSNVSDAIGKITAEDKKNALDIWNWGNIKGRSGRIDGQDRVEALGESYESVQKYIDTFIANGYDVAKTDEMLGVGAEEAAKSTEKLTKAQIEAMSEEEKRDTIIENIVTTLRHLANVAKVIGSSTLKIIKAAGEAFKDVFDPFAATKDISDAAGVLDKVAKALEITAEKAEDVKRIFRGLFSAFDIVYQLVKAIAKTIVGALVPSLGAVDAASGGFLKVLGNIGDWIYSLDQAIREGDLFSVGIDNLIGFMGGLKDKTIESIDAFERWSGIDFGKVTSAIGNAITKGLDKFKEWTGIDILHIFESIWDRIKTLIGYIKQGDFSGAFNYVVDGIKNFGSMLANAIKQINFGEILGGLGEIFGDIGKWIGNIFDKAFSGAKKTSEKALGDAKESFSILDILGGILYGGYLAIKKAAELIHGVLTSDTVKGLGTKISEFFTGLFAKNEAEDAEGSGTNKVIEFFKKLGKALAQFYEDVKPLIGAGFIAGLMSIFKDISTATKNFSEAPKMLNESLNSIAEGFNELTKATKIESMTRFMKALATSIVMLVASLVVLTLLDPADVAAATGVITTLMAEVVGALAIANTKLKTDVDMAFMAAMFKQIGNTMLVMALALVVISKVGDAKQIGATVFAFTLMMIETMAAMEILFDMAKSKQFRRGGEGVLLLIQMMKSVAESMVIMSFSLLILAKIPAGKMSTVIGGMITMFSAMAAMMTVMFIMSKEAKDSKTSTIKALSVAILAIASAFSIMAPAVLLMSLIPEENLKRATTAVLSIGGIFAAIIAISEYMSKGAGAGAVLAAGGAVLAIAVAMNMLVPMIAILSQMDENKMNHVLIAMGAMLAGIMLVLTVLSSLGGGNVALAGVGILAIALAFDIFTPALILFGQKALPILEELFGKLLDMGWKKLGKLAAIMAGLSVIMVVAGVGLIALGAGVDILAIGLSAILVAVGLAASGMAKLVLALSAAAAVWPLIRKMITELGATLAEGLIRFVEALGNGAGRIADVIKNAAPKIGEAVLAVIKTILNIIVQAVPMIVESVLQMLDLILAAIDEYLPSLLESLGSIITTILTWVSENIEEWARLITEIIVGLWVGIFTGLSNRAGELAESIITFLISVLNAFSDAIENHGDELLNAIGRAILNFFKLIGKAAKKYWYFMENFGSDMIIKIKNGLKKNISKITGWFKDLITVKIPNQLTECWDDLKQLGADLLSAIQDGFLGAWEAGKDFVKDFAEEFVDNLATFWHIKSPSKDTERLGKYLAQGVERGLIESEDDVLDTADKFGADTMDQLNDSLDLDTLDTNTDLDIFGKVHLDTSEIDTFNFDNTFDSDVLMNSLGNGFDTSSLFASSTAETDKMRQESEAANTLSLDNLTDSINKLSDKFDNGMINIPDNATFNVPVNIDGQTVANVTAPYLDVINGEKMDLESMGVTSR